jgi:hypothetical protein
MKWLDNFIVSERGQWDHPGKLTLVPTGNGKITTRGVKNDLIGIDNLGNMQYMTPENEYQFEGNMVYEIPMAYGGDISIPDLSRPNWLDKAQKGQQIKYYDDYSQYLQAEKAKTDSLDDYLKDKIAYENTLNYTQGTASPYDEVLKLVDKNEKDYGYRSPGYSPKPKVTPKLDQQAVMQQISKNYPGYSIKFDKNKIFIRQPRTDNDVDNGIFPVWHPLPIQKKKSKPQEYIPTKTVKLEREPIQLVMPQSDRTLMPYNNTMQVLRSIQQDDRDKQGPKEVPAPDFRHGGWLEKYQTKGQVTPPANLPWINQQGQFTQVPPIEPKNFESRVDDFLGNPMQKARDLASWASGSDNDPVNNLMHSGAAANMAHSTKEKTGSTLAGFAAANMLGAAHELYALPGTIKSDGWYHGLRSTAEDLFNNAVGAGIGVLPHLPIEAKESLLVHLTDNNKLPDGVSMPQGDMYWKKKKGGAIATDNQDYNYIKYKDLSLSKGTGWLDNYK